MNEDWQDGRQAYADGDEQSDCPSNLRGQRRKDWLAGWMSAWEEDDSNDRQPD